MARYKLPRFRVRLVRDRAVRYKAATPGAAAPILRSLCAGERGDRECMAVLYVDGKTNVAGAELIAVGGRHAAVTTAPEVFRGAILAGASGIILGHNHPSGDPAPSPEDFALTAAIKRAGEVLGIALLDHVIVTEDSHHSMLDNDQLVDDAVLPEVDDTGVEDHTNPAYCVGAVIAQLEDLDNDDALAVLQAAMLDERRARS